MNYSITHLEMNGMGGMQATYFISGLSVTTFIFTLFIGTIVDYLGVKKSFILAFLMGAVGIISIVFVNCSYLTWIIPLICCPFPMSMGLPIVTTAVGDYYGKKNFFDNMGICAAAYYACNDWNITISRHYAGSF